MTKAHAIKTTILRLLVSSCIAYAIVCVTMFALQRQLQYMPDRSAMSTASVGATVIEERLIAPDGTQLVSWWLPQRDKTKPVFLYFHGNGGNLMQRAERFRRLTSDGSGLYAISWRGYGNSGGSPSETGLRQDSQIAYQALASRVPPEQIVIFGESLGTTLAVMLAAEQPASALVLDSSFTSAVEIAASRYWWLPTHLLMRDHYRADLAAPNIKRPVLQIHCRHDGVTPLASAKALGALMSSVQLHIIEESCHPANIVSFEKKLREFLKSLKPD
jgi:uncharacterized protein